MSENQEKAGRWALILGGSRGLGWACAEKLAGKGYGILCVHRDRRAELATIEKRFETLRSKGPGFVSFNRDAANAQQRTEVIAEIARILGTGKVDVLVHSIAKGILKPMLPAEGSTLDHEDFGITLNAMAISLYDWTKALIGARLLGADTRVIAFTSEGSTRAIPNYGAVAAAKASLESLVRQMAVEYAPLGIRANCVQAGVTDTVSFRRIPGSERIREASLKRNPFGRLTRPEDVADVVYLLCREEAAWITGSVIKADGGESLR